VTLTFTIFNESQKAVPLGMTIGGDLSAAYLVDTVGKKKYLPIHDSEGKCVCSTGYSWLAAGDSINLWVKFPPPPASVHTIGVVVPRFAPMDDVPIT
jgi:hypothetical protein